MGRKNIVAGGGGWGSVCKTKLGRGGKGIFRPSGGFGNFFLCYGASAQDREEEERDRGYYYLSSSSFEDAEI